MYPRCIPNLIVVAALASNCMAAAAAEPNDLAELIRKIESDPDLAERNAAIKVVLELKEKAAGAIPDMLRLTKSNDPATRMIGVALLASVGPPSKVAIPDLKPLLKDENLHVRYWTCQAFAAIGPDAKEVVPDLVALLDKDAASVRRHAALAIGKIGPVAGAGVVDPLLRCLNDRAAQVRADACQALGLLGELSKPAVPVLEAKLRDSNFHANSSAAVALWRITGQTQLAVQTLLAELRGLDAVDDAVRGFADMGAAAKDAVPELEKMLTSDNAELQAYAADALGGIGPAAAAALPQLEKLAADDQPDADVRNMARDAIKRIRPK